MSSQQRQPEASSRGYAANPDQQVLESIAQALRDLRFGSIEIVVHEGKVTQIERKEKFRIN